MNRRNLKAAGVRLLQLLPVLFAITFLSFAMMRLAGSDVVLQKMERTGMVVSREMAEQLKRAYPDMPSYEVGGDRVKLAAGWLIDRAGWKGRRVGNVGVHEHQALVLVNLGGATGADVVRLADAVRQDVAGKFGIEIRPEVNFL